MTTHKNQPSPVQKGERLTLPNSKSEETASAKTSSDEANWQQMSEEARQTALSGFFKRWVEPAEDRSKCLLEGELLQAAKQQDRTKWPHLEDCDRCRHLVELGNPDRLRIPINAILAESSRKAHEIEQRSPTLWESVTAFYRGFSPVQVGLVVALCLVAFVVTIAPYHIFRPSDSLKAVVLPEDKLWATTELLGTLKAITEDPSLAPQQKIHRLQKFKLQEAQINQDIAELNHTVSGTQRAELNTLVATVQNRVGILAHSSRLPNNPNAPPEEMPNVADTAPSKIVTQVWAAFSESPTDADSHDISTAMALVDASKNSGVTSIDETGKQVVIYDLVPNRSPTKQREIKDRLHRLLEDKGVTVTYAKSSPGIPSSPREDAAPPPPAKVQ